MGCDIHASLEYLKDCNWSDMNLYIRNDELVDYDFTSRSYILFAILAGVRNDYNLKPISKPKGFPEDASKETKESYDEWLGDAHSASWLTLKELKNNISNYLKIQVTRMIPSQQAKALDEDGVTPDFWCSFTSNKDWVTRTFCVEYDGLERMVEEIEHIAGYSLYRKSYNWDVDPEKLLEKIRVVFWFDN